MKSRKKIFPQAINAEGIEGAQLHPLCVNLNYKTYKKTKAILEYPRVLGETGGVVDYNIQISKNKGGIKVGER